MTEHIHLTEQQIVEVLTSRQDIVAIHGGASSRFTEFALKIDFGAFPEHLEMVANTIGECLELLGRPYVHDVYELNHEARVAAENSAFYDEHPQLRDIVRKPKQAGNTLGTLLGNISNLIALEVITDPGIIATCERLILLTEKRRRDQMQFSHRTGPGDDDVEQVRLPIPSKYDVMTHGRDEVVQDAEKLAIRVITHIHDISHLE